MLGVSHSCLAIICALSAGRQWLNRSAESEERIKNALVRVGSPKVVAAKK